MKVRSTAIIFLLLMALPLGAVAQARKNTKPKSPAVKKPTTTPKAAAPEPTPQAEPTPTPERNSTKKNERPDDGKKNARLSTDGKNYTPTYFYEFDRPGFSYSPIKIEHDAGGRGQISFKKDAYEDVWTDPLQLTPKTLENLNSAFTELNFVDSTESYQYPGRDYSHMGNVTITLNQNGKTRTAKYNWTEKKQAKQLMDEYRRISNEYTWKFEMVTARENQPLQTPGMMDALVGYFDRGELSDPKHLVPFLTELSTDERLPLIARNRSIRLIEKINKKK